jgi:hypothetical protein
VLEDLVSRFGSGVYVKGGPEGDRATCFNAGKLEVLNFIVRKINAAAGVAEPSEE